MASQLLSKGKFGVFDPYHTNKALELTAGLHCAGVRARKGVLGGTSALQSSQSLTVSSPTRPPKAGRQSRVEEDDDVGCSKDVSKVNGGGACRGSVSSLQSLDSTGSLISHRSSVTPACPQFFSTRAAIPLMQDAFVCELKPRIYNVAALHL